MSTARDIMHSGATCVKETETLQAAAQMMRELDVGALPICGTDERLHGIITDRDIVVKCLAEGRDARTTRASELAQGKPIWVDADADETEVLRVMEDNKIRRVPVIEEHRLVGMITEADIARKLNRHEVGEFVEAVCKTT